MAPLKFRIFAHSFTSDWNHGNAHFLRGLAQELMNLGHQVRCYEPIGSWSRCNLEQEGEAVAERALRQFRIQFPHLEVRFYHDDEAFGQFAIEELKHCDVLIIHEWNAARIVNILLGLKAKLGFRALLHDTHHRAYSSSDEIRQFDMPKLDGVLAFGDAIRRIYVEGFGVRRAWTFHEAADTRHFQPLRAEKTTDVVWIGNWGDEERTHELEEFLLGPAAHLRGRFVAHGVRYPKFAKQRLAESGIQYYGYLPNLDAPQALAQSLLTLHVPRRFYANGLSGVPTIRVFEALACGIPLLCAPWTDTEGLFRPEEDYLTVTDGQAMEAEIRRLLRDDAARQQMAYHGLETIRRAHTCRHRAQQLVEICEELEGS